MRQRIIGLILAFTLVITSFPMATFADPGVFDGAGTKGNPYLIYTSADLDSMRLDIGASYKLMSDIDMLGIDYTPLGDANDPFTGDLDGNGYKIMNLTINNTNKKAGLFGETSGATFENITLENVTFTEGDYTHVGALAGKVVAGSVDNCIVTGEVVFTQNRINEDIDTYCGGLIGYISGRAHITGSLMDGDLTISGFRSSGSLVGDTYNNNVTGSLDNVSIDECYVKGIINIEGKYCGGFIGNNNGSIDNSSVEAEGRVEGTSATGGFAAYNMGMGLIQNSYATIDISAVKTVGGLVGWNMGIIELCYATGNVTSTQGYAGGLAGLNAKWIRSSFATGDVNGGSGSNSMYTGGLIGYGGGSTAAGGVENCYATGDVIGRSEVGGLIGGANAFNTIDISNCFFTGAVDGNPSSAFPSENSYVTVSNCYGGDDVDLTDIDTFVGWDFENVWKMGEDGPVLRNITYEEEPKDPEYPEDIEDIEYDEEIEGDVTITEDTTFEKNVLYKGDVILDGNLIIEDGSIVTILGDLRIQSPSYTMTNKGVSVRDHSRLYVFGNTYTETSYYQMNDFLSDEATFYLYGDFYHLGGTFKSAQSGTHAFVFKGYHEQHVSFADQGAASSLGRIRVSNVAEKVTFDTSVYGVVLLDDTTIACDKIKLLDLNTNNYLLRVEGSVIADGNTFKDKYYISGDLIVEGTSFISEEAYFEVGGDVRIQSITEEGYEETNQGLTVKDHAHLVIKGSLYTQTSYYMGANYLIQNQGILELQGDLYQIGNTTFQNAPTNQTYELLFTGDQEQHLSFENSNNSIGRIRVANGHDEINVMSPVQGAYLLESTVFKGEDVYLPGIITSKTAVAVIEGDFFSSGFLMGYYYVKGDVYCDGPSEYWNTYMEIDGNLRVQKKWKKVRAR